MRPGTVNLRSFHLGVDLGQRVDHTAFVVVEQQVVVTAHKDMVSYEYLRERKLYVRMVERVRLGQGYQEVVSEVERLTQCEEFKSGTVTTAVDATGLGIVVSEDLQRKRLRGDWRGVTGTGFIRHRGRNCCWGCRRLLSKRGWQWRRGLEAGTGWNRS